MSSKRKTKKKIDFRRFQIPDNWKLCFDLDRNRSWYELDGRVLFTPVWTWGHDLKGSHPRCERADAKALELLREHNWDEEARWEWFRTKWADLFEGGQDSYGHIVGSMGLMFRFPNGGHAHLCGRSPEETDRDIEGFRMLFGGNGLTQPHPAETPFDNINAPLFEEECSRI